MEAANEITTMNLGRRLSALYEGHMGIKRNRLYLRKMAMAEGKNAELAMGEAAGDLKCSRQAINDLLDDLGKIFEDIHSRIYAEKNTETLHKWHRAIAKAESFTAFRDIMRLKSIHKSKACTLRQGSFPSREPFLPDICTEIVLITKEITLRKIWKKPK